MRQSPTTLFAVFAIAWSTLSFSQEESPLTINGYTSFEFEKQLEEEGGGDPNGSFDADLFDLVFNLQASNRIRVSADLTWEHGAATEESFGNVAVEYAFVEYTFTDLLKVRVGKMFTPFGIFNEIHTAKPAFLSVKEPASTNKPERIVENGFRYYPRWGAGIALRGDGLIGEHDFNYDLLITNGAQEETNPFEEDNNPEKAVTGRFRFLVTDSIEIGNSFYYDTITSDGIDRISSYGVEFRWQQESWRVISELTFGWLRPDDADQILQVGWYVQPSYYFDNGMTPYFRAERVDPNTNVDSDQGYDFIVGLNYEISSGFMLKVENNTYVGAADSTLAIYPGKGYNEIKAAVVLGF